MPYDDGKAVVALYSRDTYCTSSETAAVLHRNQADGEGFWTLGALASE